MCIVKFIKSLFKRKMRRKISLYISDRLVDLDDQALVLFNYATEDLTNPTIVKNSYSQQITLKGTPDNNRIFGDIFRLDRVVSNQGGIMGTDFNPSQKTPFTIYNELGEILESGYCKLDSVSRSRGETEYHVSLFGGLGSFLYSLAYAEDGSKKTLADLDYLGTANPVNELDFIINAESVAEAWDVDPNEGEVDELWKVINFAPAYNGIPEGNFAPNKAIVKPTLVGLQPSSGGYHTRSEYALVNFSKSYDEWAVKDLRSYFQRPVLSMRAFLAAVCKPENNGGFVVNMPFLDKSKFGIYGTTWMTLPLIPSIGIPKESGDLSLSLVASATSSHDMARYNIVGSVPFGTEVDTNVNLKLRYSLPGLTDSVLYRSTSQTEGAFAVGKESVIFMQVVAYASDNSIVGGSKVKSFFSWRNTTPAEMAERCEYVPPFPEAGYERSNPAYTFSKVGSLYEFDGDLGFSIKAQDVSYYIVNVSTYVITTQRPVRGGAGYITGVSSDDNSLCTIFRDIESDYEPVSGILVHGDNDDTISYTSSGSLRSGAVITKSMLLSTSQSPADYLLSFCKIFGLHILFDKASNEITILDRSDLYQDEVIDLTKRVDISQGVEVTPFAFTSKWYDFTLPGVGGAFLDEYLATHGRDYGMQRVNTGYDFNAEAEDILAGNAFKNGATILARNKYFNIIKVSGQLRPSPFIEQGNKYTLWNDAGETLDTDIPVPPFSASVEYYNEFGHPGYDIELARKMEFRTADNKPIDGAGVLVFWEGYNTYEYFNLSDDLPIMDVLNDGVPCWYINPGSAAGLRVPIFQRYRYRNDWQIDSSLDFGVPAELDIPAVTYPESKTIYSLFWKNYLRDRYDVNTKVMRCRVNFSGLQVGQDLLRRFYWYGNSLWVLNRISNYSLTTYDPVECEFVQVQDKDNYING